jgi:hypothetical protein
VTEISPVLYPFGLALAAGAMLFVVSRHDGARRRFYPEES